MSNEKKGIRLDHISKIYRDPKTKKDFYAVKDVSLDIAPGSFVTLLGPSGCGKTTTLRMIAGFESPDEGGIYLGGEKIDELTPDKRDSAMVFQSYALLPHYNIYDNVAYGLKILLFDEPLSNLDAKLRVTMRTEIRRIQQEAGITAVYVTHDQSEAMSISDQIIIMNAGVVAQIGTPTEIYYHPKSEFVADFIGDANFLRGKMLRHEDGCGIVDIGGTEVRVVDDSVADGADTTIVLRPESTVLAEEGFFPVKVEVSCFMGAYQLYHVRLGDTKLIIHEYNPKNKRIFGQGETAYLSFASENAHCI